MPLFHRYPKLRATHALDPPPPHIYASAPVKPAIKAQAWAVALQLEANAALARAVQEQFCAVDALKQTRAERYNRDMQDIINGIQHSASKDEKRARAVEQLSPHCRWRPLRARELQLLQRVLSQGSNRRSVSRSRIRRCWLRG